MNILTISLNAWNDTQATGNTFSNFFKNNDEDLVFSNIYCRNEPYDNHICTNYYRVTESDIVNCIKNGNLECGNIIHSLGSSESFKKKKSTSHLKDLILHKYRPSVLLFLREFLWSTNKWKTSELNKFLKEVAPDVIYMHGHNNRYMHNILWYCQKITGAKVVVFFGDDMYGIKSYRPGQLLYQKWLRKKLRYTIEHADMLLGGSENLCVEYSNMFNKVFLPQYKTCNTILPPNTIRKKDELTIVYAGNLLYGRKELLMRFSKILCQINKGASIRIKLHIYSASPINEKERLILDDRNNCVFEGARPYNVICDILNQCDASLFLESFNKQNIRQTRLSFSTKIIDYMQSSSSLIVFGPHEIASVQYLETSGSALVAHNDDELLNILNSIQKDPCVLNDYANKKYEFAIKKHSASTLIPRLKELV